MGNIIVGLIAAAVIAWAARQTIRRAKKGGGCCGEREEAVEKVTVSDRNRAHYPYEAVLTIGGMTCENCARRVENALNRLDGVWASVRIDSREARVLCKAVPEETVLREAVRSAGYVATDCRVREAGRR